MYVCMYVCIYACMPVFRISSMYVCMHVFLYVSMCVCMYVCMDPVTWPVCHDSVSEWIRYVHNCNGTDAYMHA